MDVFDLSQLATAHADAGTPYHEFLRRPSLSLGLYVLPAGSNDPQKPHNEDEVYVVLSGRARIEVSGESRPVSPGSIVFVEKHVPHKFTNIEDELQVLVVFAPAET